MDQTIYIEIKSTSKRLQFLCKTRGWHGPLMSTQDRNMNRSLVPCYVYKATFQFQLSNPWISNWFIQCLLVWVFLGILSASLQPHVQSFCTRTDSGYVTGACHMTVQWSCRDRIQQRTCPEVHYWLTSILYCRVIAFKLHKNINGIISKQWQSYKGIVWKNCKHWDYWTWEDRCAFTDTMQCCRAMSMANTSTCSSGTSLQCTGTQIYAFCDVLLQ